MGRRSKYTPDVIDRLIDAIATGAIDEHACAYAGIDESTFYRWQEQKSGFREMVMRAKPKGWVEDLRLIRRAAQDGDWRAAAEHLDRTGSPYRKSVEVTGKDGGPIVLDPGWVVIRSAVIAALLDHPEALDAVSDHLDALEAGDGK